MPQDFSNINPSAQVRDLEEKHRLLKDRVLLIGKSLVDEREKNFNEIQELKKEMIIIKKENERIKELLQRLIEQSGSLARKEELLILQKQFDLFREG
jgi:hypothetical protein